MLLVDWAGAALTLLAIGLLLLGGYLGALLALRDEAARDRLSLGVATLLLATAQAIAVATVLGALGLLRLPWALALQTILVAVLDRRARRLALEGGVTAPALALLRQAWARAAEHPALAIVVAHAAASEVLRGLLRPPLAWDSLMYHLTLTATWLRDGNLAPVFGSAPVSYFGYMPANGSLWDWWWMAPSHSELYVNLAALPHWVLLGLGVGAIARRLGAVRAWPVAALLTLVAPTVVRFVATQYVDILLGGLVLAALHFGLRWLDEARWADAALAAAALGIGAGTKVLGVAYAGFLAVALLPLLRRRWPRRAAHAVGALLVAAALGSFFYLRNVALGTDPLLMDALALQCETTAAGRQGPAVPTIPRTSSVADLLPAIAADGQILDAFLGITRPESLELGVGPVSILLLLATLGLPFAVPPERRREAWCLLLFAGLVVGFWAAVPFAADRHVFANVRYLVPVVGLGFAAGVVALERRDGGGRWLPVLAIVVAAQALLQLHAEMPRGVRLALAAVDVVLVVLAVSSRARETARRHWRPLLATCAAAGFLAVPWWARFRVEDRGRAFAEELTAHRTTAAKHAGAWHWLDGNAGGGNVALMGAATWFVYPAMGPRLERDVRLVNINRDDLRYAAAYPACQPRVDPDRNAWVLNLVRRRIRWVFLSRVPQSDFPLEDRWARELPGLFAPRYADPLNVIYELAQPPAAAAGPDAGE